MFSTLLTSPRAPWSRSHSTARIPTPEFEGAAIALTNEIAAGIAQMMAATRAMRRIRCCPLRWA